jgi:hypothetical protein
LVVCQISISNQRRLYTFCKLYTAPPKDYLEYAVKSLEDAERIASRFCIYQHQCLHILDALTEVAKQAKAEVDQYSHEDKLKAVYVIVFARNNVSKS